MCTPYANQVIWLLFLGLPELDKRVTKKWQYES